MQREARCDKIFLMKRQRLKEKAHKINDLGLGITRQPVHESAGRTADGNRKADCATDKRAACDSDPNKGERNERACKVNL